MTTASQNIRVDEQRLWDSLMAMARIGPGVAGGNNRQTLTPEDGEGRTLFADWCTQAGCTMGVDEMGSMFATRQGADSKADPVCIGSHLDTQPTGGKFDGVLGVLAGLELVRTLNDHNIRTRRPIVIANWTNEEGARFAPSMLASGVFAGVYTRNWAFERTDADGIRFGDALAQIGWKGDERAGARKFHAYFELHIEQGPILEAEGADIGIVTHGQGLIWTGVTLRGTDSHAGSTPMDMRRDAALGMARLVLLVNEVALRHGPGNKGTVGHVNVRPNSRNVVAGHVEFTVDLRSADPGALQDMDADFRQHAAEICAGMNLDIAFEDLGGFDPVTFDPGCARVLRGAAERLGYAHRDIVSGAGHDACWVNKTTPAAMVMCPCVGGLSHNEAEEIYPQWARAGADVLLHAALEAAGVESGRA